MMGIRDLKESNEKHYFKHKGEVGAEYDGGLRDMFPLAPFVISGGTNTERYYFIHVNDLSQKYKFNLRPEYFGDESAYIDIFPKKIEEIMSKNTDAKIFCVFDMDTVHKYGQMEKHEEFIRSLKTEIENHNVVICDSLPSFEFWLLLHFVDYKGFLKNYSQVSEILSPHLKPYFKSVDKKFKKLIKSKKYLKDSTWVKKLLEEGRLDLAIERAKLCIERTFQDEVCYSYSNVFKAFED